MENGIAMTDRIYCYHCRSYHPPHEVTLVFTASGKRWRCVKSFSFAQPSQAQRDTFGKAAAAPGSGSDSLCLGRSVSPI
jgi:hypothetical protein